MTRMHPVYVETMKGQEGESKTEIGVTEKERADRDRCVVKRGGGRTREELVMVIACMWRLAGVSFSCFLSLCLSLSPCVYMVDL